jgi:hypothetical protein
MTKSTMESDGTLNSWSITFAPVTGPCVLNCPGNIEVNNTPGLCGADIVIPTISGVDCIFDCSTSQQFSYNPNSAGGPGNVTTADVVAQACNIDPSVTDVTFVLEFFGDVSFAGTETGGTYLTRMVTT